MRGKLLSSARAPRWSSSVFVVALLAGGATLWSATAEHASAAPITKVLWVWEEKLGPREPDRYLHQLPAAAIPQQPGVVVWLHDEYEGRVDPEPPQLHRGDER